MNGRFASYSGPVRNVVVVLCLLLIAATTTDAAPGDLDPNFAGVGKFRFGFGGSSDLANAMTVQEDGKIVVVGKTLAGAEHVFVIARYLPDGSPDVTFGPNGTVLTNIPEGFPDKSNYDEATAVTIQPDGRIVVAGTIIQQQGDHDFVVVRYHPDGALDTSFGGDGIALVNFSGVDIAYAVRVLVDGKIAVAGYKNNEFALARLNPDGTLDSSFHADGKVTTVVGSGNAGLSAGLTVQDDGKLVMAGAVAGVNGFIVARYKTDGSLDNDFDVDGTVVLPMGSAANAHAVAMQPASNPFFADRIVVGGSVFNGTRTVFAVARCTASGALDTSLDGDGMVTTDIPGSTRSRGFNLVVESSFKAPGRIVLAGSRDRSISGGLATDFALVRYSNAGALDTSFDGDGIVTTVVGGGANATGAQAVVLLAGGKLMACGAANADAAIISYHADGSLDTTFDGDGAKLDDYGGPPAHAGGVVVQPDGKIVVAGDTTLNFLPTLALARFNADGTFDGSFGSGGKIVDPRFLQQGNAIALQPDGKIVVAGSGTSGTSVAEITVNRLGADGTPDPTFSGDGFATIQVAGDAETALAVAIQPDGKIIAVGRTRAAVNNNDVVLVRLTPDGSPDPGFDFDGQIVIGLSSGNDEASAIALQPDGKIVIAGAAGSGTESRFFVARFHSDGTPDSSFGDKGVVFTSIGAGYATGKALALLPSGHIVVAGYAYNGTNLDFAFVRYHQDGALDTSLGGTGVVMTPLSEGNDEATALAVQGDGKFVLAGGINPDVDLGTTDPNAPIRRGQYAVARYNFDGSLDPAYGSGGKIVVAYDPDGNDRATGVALDSANRAVLVGKAGEIFGLTRIEGGPLVATRLANISTRLRVETGDNVLIGGFIVTGSTQKRIIVRALGPSLPVNDQLANPSLELYNGSGELIASNDNWQDAPNRQEIIDSTIAPPNDLESAILQDVELGPHTAIVSGAGGGTGVGLVEVYDLGSTQDSKLANISTRGRVQAGDNVMIGGLIITGSAPQKLIVRAIGPSLPVEGTLQDPLLELYDGNGTLMTSNNNWKETQQAEIEATGIPPPNEFESAIVTFLPPAAYTAVVRGVNDTTGVALVEVYALQ